MPSGPSNAPEDGEHLYIHGSSIGAIRLGDVGVECILLYGREDLKTHKTDLDAAELVAEDFMPYLCRGYRRFTNTQGQSSTPHASSMPQQEEHVPKTASGQVPAISHPLSDQIPRPTATESTAEMMKPTQSSKQFDPRSTVARRQHVIRFLASELALEESDIENRIVLLYPRLFYRLFVTGHDSISEVLIGYVAEKQIWINIFPEHGKSLKDYQFEFPLEKSTIEHTPMCIAYDIYRRQRLAEQRRTAEDKDRAKEKAVEAQSLARKEEEEDAMVKREPSED